MFFIFTTCLVKSQGSNPIYKADWAFGASGDDYLMDLIETEDAFDLLMAGHTSSFNGEEVSEFGYGYSDIWVLKQNLNEQILWNKKYGGDSTELMAEILELKDGYLFVGSSASGSSGNKSDGNFGGFDYWVFKTDKNGNKIWDKSFGGSGNDYATCVSLAPDGGFYIGGYSESTPSGNKSSANYGGFDYWLVKITTSGILIGDESYGGDKDDIMKSILIDGNLILAGYTETDVNGTKTVSSFGLNDYWLIELETNGVTEVNQYVFGGTRDDKLDKLESYPNGPGFYVAGSSESGSNGNKTSSNYGESDYWILRLDSTRGIKWQTRLGGNRTDVLTDMIIDPLGASIVAGYSNSISGGNKSGGNQGGFDYWAVKLDTLGNIYWQKNYGGSSDDSLQAIYLRCDRGLYLGGYSESDISGDRTDYSRRFQDYWVISLDVPTIPKFRAQDHCFGTALNFTDESELFPDIWIWDFGDPLSGNNSSDDRNPLHTFSAPGEYEVTLTIKEGCQKDTSLTKTITVFDNKVLNRVDIGEDFFMCLGESAELRNTKKLPSDATFLWSTGDSTKKTIADTMGFFTLEVTSGNCSESDTLEIDVCPILFVPNAFTPNGDELNDTWGATGEGIREYQLYIFNRWGQNFYESNELYDWWDGTYKGNDCQQDVYVYKIIFTGLNGPQQIRVGTVTLVR